MMKRRYGKVKLKGTAKNGVNDGFFSPFHSDFSSPNTQNSPLFIGDERGISSLYLE